MKNKKSILLVIILMAVGFAAVSTTLYINGQTKINPNQDDFNVYYSDAYVNGKQDKSVITDDTHIVFETELSTLGEKYVLDYEVTNGSKNYDAELVMECTGDNEYLTVTNEFDDDSILKAKAVRDGKLTLELTKSNAGEDVEVTIACTISANAVERDSLGSGITVTAKDENNTELNAKAYEITDSEKTTLLNALVETGYVDNASEIDAIIEVKSDEFENLAITTFNVSSIASEGDKIVILHFNKESSEWEYISEEVVDENGEITANFTSYSPVAFIVNSNGEYKYKWIYEDTDNSGTITVGDRYSWKKEKFNVISQTDESISMLSMYALDKNFKQTISSDYNDFGVSFASKSGWEYTPGPKEIDIQTWSTNPKTYVNNYLSYLQTELGDNTITGDLITLNELKQLGCTFAADYAYVSDTASLPTCANSLYRDWLVNEQKWWTKSANSTYGETVWVVEASSRIGNPSYYRTDYGVRPVITVSKDALNNN